MKKIMFVVVMILILILSLGSVGSVSADVAPPETPPGSNLAPGTESTQVRMLAETVILTVSEDPADPRNAIARTNATFTMRNLGNAEEVMQARFPLTFFNGNSDGFGNFPEIPDISIKVNGRTVPDRRELQPFLASEGPAYQQQPDIPWAVFNVVFPPSQDVVIDVSYTVSGYGYYPYEAFRYVLETGAGWYGTIGVADVIVRFPYDVDEKNIGAKDADYAGYGSPTPGSILSGREVRWHFEDLEPTWKENIQILIVTPSLWESVLRETGAVTQNSDDGEAWGRLGKAYKEIIRMSKGYLREDSAGLEMFQSSRTAYETCLDLLPEDPVWHFGYADLLWSYYYFNILPSSKGDPDGFLPTILAHLQTALMIDPDTQQARNLLEEISYAFPEAVQMNGDDFIFLGLTATPLPPTPWLHPTGTALPSPTIFPPPTVTIEPVEPAMTITPKGTTVANPICGSSAILLPLVGGILWAARRKRT